MEETFYDLWLCVCALFKFFVFTFFSCWFDLYINDIL